MNMYKKLTSLVVVGFGVIACSHHAYDISQKSLTKKLVAKDAVTFDSHHQGSSYGREISQRETLSKKVVNVSGKQLNLLSVLKDVFPGKVYLPQDQSVDLHMEVDILTPRMSAGDFLQYLEGVTGYAYELEGKTLHIKSHLIKTWNLSTLVDGRGVINSSVTSQTTVTGVSDSEGTPGESSSVIRQESQGDGWDDAIRTAETYLNVSSGGDEGDSGGQNRAPLPVDYDTLQGNANNPFESQGRQRPDPFKPFVTGNRSLGVLTAAGPVGTIRQLDKIFSKIQNISQTMFNVQVTVYEVVLDENKQKGINWDFLREGAFGVNNLNLGFNKLFQSTFDSDVFQGVGGYTSDRTRSSAILRFLESFGEVELLDQPSLLTRNGVPSKIYAGNELTFVGDFELVTTDSDNVIVAPKFEKLKIGVSLSVTARYLDGDKILLDIWPVISTVDGQESFNVNGFEFRVPQRSLKEFATQVVTTSGKSVHLGGLIRKQLRKALRGLPIENKHVKGVFDIPFEDVTNELERREIVLVVTPTMLKAENI